MRVMNTVFNAIMSDIIWNTPELDNLGKEAMPSWHDKRGT